ncbi:MAG: LssY C-terminal domain-containing protein, partial [Gammaproteobacteria bacterium]
SERNLRLTTAVPSAEEAQEIFGVKLYRNNVQPVWVQVENLGDVEMMLLPVGLDRAYYTPLETASRHYPWEKLLNPDADADFRDRKMAITIPAGAIQSGYIFSRVDEGTKSFNVDVVPRGGTPYRMTFFVPVPGLRIDHYQTQFDQLYPEDEIVDVDLQGLVSGLEALPCCVMNEKGKDFGDPLNIAFVGEIDDLYYSFLRAGWDETETVYGSSLWKMAKSAVAGSEYRYSPVSALYVYGRAQDAALQRARSSINERNHLRIWMTPMRYEGKPVWIGQISRDIGVRFTTKTITTHKIDPDVDETREFLVEDLLYAQGLAKIGYVRGVGAAPFDEPRGNLTGDPYFTDGRRAVMWVSGSTVGIDEIEIAYLGGYVEAK